MLAGAPLVVGAASIFPLASWLVTDMPTADANPPTLNAAGAASWAEQRIQGGERT